MTGLVLAFIFLLSKCCSLVLFVYLPISHLDPFTSQLCSMVISLVLAKKHKHRLRPCIWGHSHHHQSSFPILSGLATWILPLRATQSFQRPSVILRAKRSFLTVLVQLCKGLSLCLLPSLTRLSKLLFIGTVGDLNYHVSCPSDLILCMCYF